MARREPRVDPPIALAVRGTLALVVAGAIAIATYGHFVIGRPRIDPRIEGDVRLVETLAASLAEPCATGFAQHPLAQNPLAARATWASADCGYERDPGSGIASTEVRVVPIGSRDGIDDDWEGDLDSRRCATSPVTTCTAIFVHRAHPEWTRIVSVRRLRSGDGWTRVEAIVRAE